MPVRWVHLPGLEVREGRWLGVLVLVRPVVARESWADFGGISAGFRGRPGVWGMFGAGFVPCGADFRGRNGK